jgi:hypothetical protein
MTMAMLVLVGVVLASQHLASATEETKKEIDLSRLGPGSAKSKEKDERAGGEDANDEDGGEASPKNDDREKGDGSSQDEVSGERPDPDPDDLEALGRASPIPEKDRVYVLDEGPVRVVTDEQAKEAGYTIVDLSDGFAPYIFSERTPGKSDYERNDYRSTYIGVANDRIDEKGERLSRDQHNYVELFGIPPSLSVLQRRFITDVAKDCYDKLDMRILRRYRGVIRYKGDRRGSVYLNRYRELVRKVRGAKRAAGVSSVAKLGRVEKYRSLVHQYRVAQVRVEIIHQAQLRLRCEGLLDRSESYRRRHMDYVTHKALARFERKHMIFGWGQLYGKTLRYLGSDPTTNNHRALLRTLRERVVHSAGIIEDGTASKAKSRGIEATYTVDGEKRRVKDLVASYTKYLAERLGVAKPKDALEFFRKYPPELFRHLRVAVRFPKKPPYYDDVMKLHVEIDRGDVWYDYPYDDNGDKKPQPRSRMPRLTLFVLWKDQKIPLVHWPTTIGGWRREHKDGKRYLKYKNSDVGLRMWRNIVAAPVWIPPPTTPPAGLVTKTKKNGRWRYRVKNEEIGPSYRSAYGLVAAYHIQQLSFGANGRWRDNGIRTHGSVNYMSIFGAYSHGCHRLHNHLAVRLFSYILQHSRFDRKGQIPLAYARRFSYRGRKLKIERRTRGYKFSLKTPVSVVVTEGRVRGETKEPIEHYMPYPGIDYAEDDPNLKPGGEKEGDGWAPADAMPKEVPPADEDPIHPASAEEDDSTDEAGGEEQPRPSPRAEPQARPRGEPRARPAARPRPQARPRGEPRARPAARPRPQARPRGEPRARPAPRG